LHHPGLCPAGAADLASAFDQGYLDGHVVLLAVGTLPWFLHGSQIGSWPVIAANAVITAMLVMAVRYK
jgi:hypothetical protein